jgi:hypothetical protein
MRRVALVFGVLAGVIISILLIVNMRLCIEGTINFDNSEITGYGSMVIALSMIFFGIKSYRDNNQNGAIRFTQGLKVGMLITLIASLIYAVAGETLYQVNPESQAALMEKYADHHINKMKAKGVSAAEIDQKAKEMADLNEMVKNPLIRFAMALAIIFPVGIVITLLSAALLRRKGFLPVTETRTA